VIKERALKEKFPPYCGPEWEKKINNPIHPNFWRYGVANLIFLDFVGKRKVILDVGCGTGGSTFFLAENCEIDLIVGVDVVKSMIQVAKEKTRGEQLKCKTEFIVCDGRQLPFRDLSFEALISRGDVFVWLIPQDKALQEFSRVMKTGAVIVMEMDNGALLKVKPANRYFEKTYDGKIVYLSHKVDADRNWFVTCYVLRKNSEIAKKISQNPKFIKNGWYLGEEYFLKDIERETIEIRQGLTTHWYTAEGLRDLFEIYGFKEIEVIGDGLLMKLLLEGNEKIAELMKKQPELFFEIERRLIPFINPDKAPTIIVKGLKVTYKP